MSKRMELYSEGLTDKEIAEELDLTSSAIGYWRRRNNLSVNTAFERRHKKRMWLYRQGLTDRKIAEELNTPIGTIRGWRQENYLEANPKYDYDEEKMTRLYQKGLSDIEIGKKVGLSRTTIMDWRNENNLPINDVPRVPLTDQEKEDINFWYEQGYNDAEIAYKIDRSITSVTRYRHINDLPPNSNKGSKGLSADKQRKRMELYSGGLTDEEMAEELELSSSAIRGWRKRNNLPVNNSYKKKHKKRMELYNEGQTDREIAEETSVAISTVIHWRKRNNLPPNNKEE